MNSFHPRHHKMIGHLSVLWSMIGDSAQNHQLAMPEKGAVMVMMPGQADANVEACLQNVGESLPETAFPLFVGHDPEKSSDPDIRLAGVKIPSFGMIKDVTADLLAIDGMMKDLPMATSELFAIGRPGKLNPDKRDGAVWARSPVEAVLKFFAELDPGFTSDPCVFLELGLDLGFEMRAVSDWREIDIGIAVEEAKALIRSFDEPDLPAPG